MSNRELDRETRALRDQQKAQTRSAATASQVVAAKVSSLSPGAAGDGRDLVSVIWKGGEATCAGYSDTYTPHVGDRVACLVIDNQLIIDFRIVGYP